jgi:hypothetical protein
LESGLVLATGLVFVIQTPAQPPQEVNAATKGEFFVPLPAYPEEKFVKLPELNDPDLAWLSSKNVKVRYVSGSGVGRPRLLPVYALKAVAAEPEKIGPEGIRVPPAVVIDLFDLLQQPKANETLRGVLSPVAQLANYIEVMPDWKSGVSSSFLPGKSGVRGNPVSVHHSCPKR